MSLVGVDVEIPKSGDEIAVPWAEIGEIGGGKNVGEGARFEGIPAKEIDEGKAAVEEEKDGGKDTGRGGKKAAGNDKDHGQKQGRTKGSEKIESEGKIEAGFFREAN